MDLTNCFKKYAQAKIFIVSFSFTILIWYLVAGLKPPLTWEYSGIAENIIKQHSFSFTHLGAKYLCFCPPLYAFIVALIYLLSNYNHLAVIFTQIFFFSFLCIVVFEIGRNIFNLKVGLIAVIGLMLHPGILFYVLRNEHTLILDAFMFSASALSILLLYDNPGSIKKTIICGVVLGLSFLSRGTALILAPVFVLWALFTFNLSIKKRLYASFFIVLISLAVILPWAIRNYNVTKKIILIGAATEETFWRGNNMNASGSSYDVNGRTILNDLADRDFLRKIYAEDEMGQKKIFEKEAICFIKNNPGKFINFFLKKFYYFWWFSPQAGIMYSILYKTVYKIYYSVALIFVFLGFYSIFKSKENKNFYNKIYLLIGMCIAISFFQSIFYVEMRHRWAIEPMLLIFAANGIIYIKDKIMTVA